MCNSWLIPRFILNVELSSFCKELWLGSTFTVPNLHHFQSTSVHIHDVKHQAVYPRHQQDGNVILRFRFIHRFQSLVG